MIDIVIPFHNAKDTIKYTLSSIAYQSMVDSINVYLVDDASDEDYKDEIELFKSILNLKIIKLKKNRGPGYARQKGIEAGTGEFIIFLDSDDIFHSSNSVEYLYRRISDTGTDFVIGNFVEESEYGFTEHKNDWIWLHGKIYRRSFLEKHNIKMFELRRYEDLAFNYLCRMNDYTFDYLDCTVYVWCNNKKSITRVKEDEHYHIMSIPDYVKSTYLSVEWGMKNKKQKNNAISIAYSCIYMVYLYYMNYKNNSEYRSVEEKIYEYSRKLYEYIDESKITKNEKRDLGRTQLRYFLDTYEIEELLNFDISFDEFISKKLLK